MKARALRQRIPAVAAVILGFLAGYGTNVARDAQATVDSAQTADRRSYFGADGAFIFLVTVVKPGSPADQAGIRAGDELRRYARRVGGGQVSLEEIEMQYPGQEVLVYGSRRKCDSGRPSGESILEIVTLAPRPSPASNKK
ncbi:MAG: PDZ domain-containing protein [Acidobacteriota bacterium]